MGSNAIASKINIKTNGITAEITVDGHVLKGVRAYELKHTANGIPILTLDLQGLDVTFDADTIKYQSINGQELTIEFKKHNEIK